VYSWGANDCGQLGLGHTKMIDRPTKIPSLAKIKISKIRAGHNHAIAMTTFGDIYTWGSNHCGQLGRKPENFAIPGLVIVPTVIFRNVDCNDTASAAISNKGELYTWGSGGNGRLGHGNTRNYEEPELVKEVKDVPFLQVSLGTHHTLALTETKQIYAWGAGHHGELGLGGRRRQLKPVALNIRDKMLQVLAREEISLAISASGGLYSWGNCAGGLLGNGRKVGNVLIPTKINTVIEFRSISASKRHVVATGVGNAQPPYEHWKEEDETVDPDATKQYTEEEPEKYLYPLYFPPSAPAERERRKQAADNKGGEEGHAEAEKEETGKGDD